MQLRDDGRIKGFDGLRALAFLLVFISHKSALPERDTYGGIGVMTFFVLSGLLITRILALLRADIESGEATTVDALKRFYLRRTARIFPIYYGLLTFFLIASPFVHFDGFEGGRPLVFLLFGTNIYEALPHQTLGHFAHLWTLAIEEQFYLLFAPLILFSPRSRAWRICAAFVALAVAVKVGQELASGSTPFVGLHTFVGLGNTFIGFGFLGLGGLLGLSLDSRAPAWLVSGPAVAVSAIVVTSLTIAWGVGMEQVWAAQSQTYVEFVCIVSALLIFQIARNQGSAVVAVLKTWPLRNLGRISYGAYLFHEFIHFYNLQQVAAKLGFNLQAPLIVQMTIELALTVAVSAASWKLLERPMISLGARLTRRDTPDGNRAAVVHLSGQATGTPPGGL